MKRYATTAVLLAALVGCAGTQPPERLISVTAELVEAEALELAELQPNLLREAQDHRDAAWEAVDQGDAELAELHAWVSWLRLRTAENLEAILQNDGLARARGAPAGAASRPDGVAGTASPPAGQGAFSGPGRAGASGSDAALAVREAENARLRLLSAGLRPDLRWAEAEALLQTAQRALDRGDFDRAHEMGSRAAFVFEVVRLTRLGEVSTTPLASVSAGEGDPRTAPAASFETTATDGEREPTDTEQPTPAEQASADPGVAPSEVIATDGSVTVIVPSASTPALDTAGEPSEDDPTERPRSRIISNILQPAGE